MRRIFLMQFKYRAASRIPYSRPFSTDLFNHLTIWSHTKKLFIPKAFRKKAFIPKVIYSKAKVHYSKNLSGSKLESSNASVFMAFKKLSVARCSLSSMRTLFEFLLFFCQLKGKCESSWAIFSYNKAWYVLQLNHAKKLPAG